MLQYFHYPCRSVKVESIVLRIKMPHHKPNEEYSERSNRRDKAKQRDRLFEIDFEEYMSESEFEEEIPIVSEEESPIVSEEDRDISSDSDLMSDNDPMEEPDLLRDEHIDSAGTVPRSQQSMDAMFII